MDWFGRIIISVFVITLILTVTSAGLLFASEGNENALAGVVEFAKDSKNIFSGPITYVNEGLVHKRRGLATVLNDKLDFIDDFIDRRVNLGSVSASSPTLSVEGKIVSVDLEKKKLYLYEDGEVLEELPVLSIGKPGSPWETPAGSYEIKTKEKNHYSTIGEVYMPHSMQFFGNFFIHGWPYYPDGTPVSEGYSGGCIRLSDEDAGKVFEFSEIGTEISIINGKSEKATDLEQSFYLKKRDTEPPKPEAKSYLVADLETGDLLLAKNIDTSIPIASVSKLMTALVSLEVVNQFQDTKVSRSAVNTYGGAGDLVSGETLDTGETIYPLLLESSNDAAEVIAEHIGRERFMSSMNEKAESIGLLNTSFEDPSGLSPHNRSTARDLYKMARFIYKNKKHIFDITTEETYTSKKGSRTHTWYNNNPFSRSDHDLYIGGKHGYTDEADHSLVALFEAPLGEFETRTIAVVLLKSDNWERDADRVLTYLDEYVYYGTPAEHPSFISFNN